MKIVFICAPYTASTEEAIAGNITKAEKVARQLAEREIGFVCPHTNSAYMHDINEASPDFWYKMYLAILDGCDALLAVGRWQNSAGCLLEVARAKRLNLPIFYSIEEVVAWHK